MSITSLSSKTGRATCRVIDHARQLPHNAKLISLRINGSEVFVKNATDVLVWICKEMMLYRTQRLRDCIRKRHTSWIKRNRNGMSKPYQIFDNCFIDLNVTDREALQRASLVLQWVLWSHKDAIITYKQPSAEGSKPIQNAGAASVHSTQTFDATTDVVTFVSGGRLPPQRNEPLQLSKTKTVVSLPFYERQIAELLEAEFVNGVRLDIIGCSKVRKFYRQQYGKELPEDFDLDSALSKIGVVHDGKVYPRPSSKGGGWRKLVERLVEQGYTVFLFSRLVELHASEFMQMGIVSPKMLREIMLREAQNAYEISEEFFFAHRGQEPFAKHLISIVMSQKGSIVDLISISKREPYAGVEFFRTLCKVLGSCLIKINQDLYAISSQIEFDAAEVSRGKSQCEAAIEADGFFSLSQLRLDDSMAMNDRRLTDSALRRSFSQRFLSKRFDTHGQIVCKKGESVSGQIPLRVFLREQSDVSLAQLEAMAEEYNIKHGVVLKTTHEEMVRVDRERFVAPTQIAFDVPLIDKSIASICEGNIMPFGAFTNLSDFPAVPGYAWNEFLLEAFLRRASAEFRLASLSVPAKEVSGAIVPHSQPQWSAVEAFAIIALRCGVVAEENAVGNFLVEKQCVLRRSKKAVGTVVAKMKELDHH